MYKDKIFFQKLEFLYGELKKILISVFFMGLVIVYYLHGMVETDILVLWMFINIVILFYRYYIYLKFKNDKDN